MSFTLINDPLKLSSTLNNEPCVPSTLNTTDPDTSEPLLLIFNLAFGLIVPIPILLPVSYITLFPTVVVDVNLDM